MCKHSSGCAQIDLAIIAIYDDVEHFRIGAHLFAPTDERQTEGRKEYTSLHESRVYKTIEVLCSASSVAVRHLVECHRTTCALMCF